MVQHADPAYQCPPYPREELGRPGSLRSTDMAGGQPDGGQDIKGSGAPCSSPHRGHRGGDQLDGGGVAHHQHAQRVGGHTRGCCGSSAGRPPDPEGVAALPSPSKLADTLAAMVSIASRSRANCGIEPPEHRHRSSRDSFSASPERRITSITPIHRHSTPAMDRHSSTAAWRPRPPPPRPPAGPTAPSPVRTGWRAPPSPSRGSSSSYPCPPFKSYIRDMSGKDNHSLPWCSFF